MAITIERLQAHAAGPPGAPLDPGALRARLAGLLGGADLEPRGLPPAAILVVRRLADPLPGCLAPWDDPFRARSAWERAARQALEDLARQAARPVRGRLAAANRPAVLFSDQSELLACLALDLCQGQAGQHWWWQSILVRQLPGLFGPRAQASGGASGASLAIYTLLVGQVELLPAVLDTLSSWGEAEAILTGLEPGQCLTLLRGLARACALPRLAEALLADWQPTPSSPDQPAEAEPLSPAVWQAERAVLARLNPPQAALLWVSIMVQRAPQAVRSAGFAHRVAQTLWSPPGVRPWVPASPAAGISGANRGVAAADPGARPASDAGSALQPGEPPGGAGFSPSPGQPSGRLDVTSQAGAPSGSPDLIHTARSQPSPAAVPAAIVAAETPPAPTAWSAASELRTQWGGLLYLVNLISSLDLPDCFPSDPPLAGCLDAWGALALLGLGLCSAPLEELLPDPIWPALAGLAGLAPGEMPGANLPRSAGYTLPLSWYQRGHGDLQPHPAGCRWAESGGDLLVWADEGFLLLRAPRSSVPAGEQSQTLLEKYLPDGVVGYLSPAQPGAAPLARLSRPLVETLSPGAADWLACGLPYLTLLLRAALRLGPGDDLTANLLRAPGQLYITRTHVDLVLPLESISLPVRATGLDRDPGWLPGFGRVILFHYE